MKISDYTIEVLKNFSTINMGLLIKQGNKLRTRNTNTSILAEAIIEETFDRQIGVYDLNKFLALLSMKKGGSEISIEDNSFVFHGISNGKIRMRFTEPNILVYPDDNNPEPNYIAKFEITQEVLTWINNAASILKCPNLVFKCDGESITMWAMDVGDDRASSGAITDDASVNLGGKCNEPFAAVFNISNMVMIPGGYDVELAQGFIKCTHKTKKMTYWIAMEKKKSIFGTKGR